MKKIWILMGALLFIFTALPTQAAYVELNSGAYAGYFGAVGSGRGIGFQADAAFTVDSVGFYGNLNQESFDVVIFSSTNGNQANSILTSSTAVVGGTGIGWNEISINYSFNAGDYYVLNWRPTNISTDTWGAAAFYRDSVLPAVIGEGDLVTLINGVEGFGAENFSNTLHPNLRVNTVVSAVPVPAAVWLFCSALIGLLAFSQRKHSLT